MAWEQGAGEPEGDPPPPMCCARGLEVNLAWEGSRGEAAVRSLSIMGILSYGQRYFFFFFPACFYHFNSDGDSENGSPAAFWGTDEHVFKEHWERRNNCRRLAINWKLNLTVRGDVHK